MKRMQLRLDQLTRSPRLQPRAEMDEEVIEDYADAYRRKQKLPPVVVFYDGKTWWLADGYHRAEGARRAGCTTIAAEVRKGTQREAQLYSCGANAEHGLRRTNADKRLAVPALLGDAEWAKKSDRWIAEVCRVSADLVGEMRRERRSTVGTDRSEGGEAREGRDRKRRKPPRRKACPKAPNLPPRDGEETRPARSEQPSEPPSSSATSPPIPAAAQGRTATLMLQKFRAALGGRRDAIIAAVEKLARETDRLPDWRVKHVEGMPPHRVLRAAIFIPGVWIDRTEDGTKHVMDRDLQAICECSVARPTLDGLSMATFLRNLRGEITRRRKENHDARQLKNWNPEQIVTREQTRLLDWIEDELDKLPSWRALRHHDADAVNPPEQARGATS